MQLYMMHSSTSISLMSPVNFFAKLGALHLMNVDFFINTSVDQEPSTQGEVALYIKKYSIFNLDCSFPVKQYVLYSCVVVLKWLLLYFVKDENTLQPRPLECLEGSDTSLDSCISPFMNS